VLGSISIGRTRMKPGRVLRWTRIDGLDFAFTIEASTMKRRPSRPLLHLVGVASAYLGTLSRPVDAIERLDDDARARTSSAFDPAGAFIIHPAGLLRSESLQTTARSVRRGEGDLEVVA